jgi:hypothetical protein
MKRNHKKVTKLGSKWNNGLKSGTFYWNLNNATSNRNRNISRQSVNARYSRGKSKTPRLFLYNLCILEYPAAWQNSQPAREVKNNF